MCRKHGCEKKLAFDHFSRDLGVDPFFASDVGGERQPSCQARRPHREAARAGLAVSVASLCSFRVLRGTEAGHY